jgi:hypothetical protein
MFFSVIAAAILLSLSSATANAQQFPSDVVSKYTNKPCSNPYVSWALWSRSEGFSPGSSGTSADCNTNNYGTWSTAAQLLSKVDIYHYEKKLRASGISYNGAFTGRDGNKYCVFGRNDAIVGINIGRVVGTAGGSFISNDGATLVSTNGGNIIAQGGGNLVPGATVIAQGGGNLISANSGKVIAQGGGNLTGQGSGAGRVILAAGSTLFQFPNRYAVVSGAPAPAPQPTRPPTPPAPTVRSDDQILLCTNSSSGLLAQIKRADGGANHITFFVTSGTAYFSGNVLTQSYKDQLTNAARTCGARNVSNNLRIGR